MRFNKENIYKFIIDKFINIKLKRKIIISFVCIVAVPILVVAFLVFYNVEQYIESSTIKNHKYQLDIEHDKMINNVSIIESISNVLVSNEEIIKFISESDKISNYEFYELSSKTYKVLNDLQNNNQYISAINIFPENNDIAEMWPFIYNKSRINKEEWYKELSSSDDDALWDLYHYDDDIEIAFYTGKKVQELVVSLNSKIIDDNNNVLGIVRISMKVEDFLPIMATKTLNKYNSVFIYNSNTKRISGEEEFLKAGITKENRNEFFENISDNLIGSSESFEINNEKEELFIMYKKAPISNCYIVDVISLDSLTNQISKAKIYTLLGTATVILLLIYVIWIITDFILKRLYIIIDSLKEIESGNFNADINVYGDDEIGLLAHKFRKMIKKINLLIKEGIRKEMATKDAELRALKTQIDAHFLYNTLENIKMMAEVEENYMVSDSLSALGDLMRYNTKWNKEYVMLNEELLHIKNYISLMALRYEYCINLNINIDEKLKNVSILKMIIQPLVENAVKHGISKKLKNEDANVYINIKEDNKCIVIEVEDDGIGMDEKKINILQEHISGQGNGKYGLGLKNVYERVKLAYGSNSRLNIESQLNKGTKLILIMPKN